MTVGEANVKMGFSMPAASPSASSSSTWHLDQRELVRTSVGETRGQDQDVILSPLVRKDDLLGRIHKFAHVIFELPLAASQLVRAGSHHGPRADGGGDDIAGGGGGRGGGGGGGRRERGQ